MSKIHISALNFNEYDTRKAAKKESHPNNSNKNKTSILIQNAIHNSKGYKQAVMVVSSFGKSTQQSVGYVDYIAQEENTSLYNKEGKKIEKDEAKEKVKQWVNETKKRKGVTRYTIHIVLQSEPNANEKKAKKGMEEFLKKEFNKNEYIYAFHTDKKSPHIHVSIKMQGENHKKIQATKSDLRDWRENYAASMREQGFEYTSTSRVSRGKVGKSLAPSSKIKFGFYDKEIKESMERTHDQENIEKWKKLYKKIGIELNKSNKREVKDTGESILNLSKEIEKEK